MLVKNLNINVDMETIKVLIKIDLIVFDDFRDKILSLNTIIQKEIKVNIHKYKHVIKNHLVLTVYSYLIDFQVQNLFVIFFNR